MKHMQKVFHKTGLAENVNGLPVDRTETSIIPVYRYSDHLALPQ